MIGANKKKKVSEFVIVIDTSMSCSGELVQRFLEETYGILSDSGNFFFQVPGSESHA